MSDAVIGPKEMVVTTAFYVKNTGDKGQSKPVFTTASAVFSRFEQLDEVMSWATRGVNEPGKRLLKLEISPNSR